MARAKSDAVYRVVSPFAVHVNGSPVQYRADQQVAGDDPIVRSHALHFEDVTDLINQPTPIDQHPARMPSGVTNEEATRARDVRDGPRNKGGTTVPHLLPPEHEDSPASTFAPFQPAAGVQADDVVEKGQAPKGALKASDAQEKFAGKTVDTSTGHTGEADAGVNEASVDVDTDKSGGDPLKSKSGDAPTKSDDSTPAKQSAAKRS
jgi:hypothetical protein